MWGQRWQCGGGYEPSIQTFEWCMLITLWWIKVAIYFVYVYNQAIQKELAMTSGFMDYHVYLIPCLDINGAFCSILFDP